MGLQETGSDAAASGQLASEPRGLLVPGLCPRGEHPADPELLGESWGRCWEESCGETLHRCQSSDS